MQSPTGQELLQLLQPPPPATPDKPVAAADGSATDEKLSQFFGEAMDAESSMLFAIVKTGHVVVKHVCDSSGKKLKKVRLVGYGCGGGKQKHGTGVSFVIIWFFLCLLRVNLCVVISYFPSSTTSFVFPHFHLSIDLPSLLNSSPPTSYLSFIPFFLSLYRVS